MGKILITGAAGYVGSYLAYSLPKDELVLIDNYSKPSPIVTINGIKIKHLDIRDKFDVRLMLDGVSTVVHLASMSGIKKCKDDPTSFASNVVGTKNLTDAAIKKGVKKFIFASTSAVYGSTKDYLMSEEHSKDPVTEYGKQKLEAESYIKEIKNHIIYRKSNVYGKGLLVKTTVIDNFIQKALTSEPIEIQGDGKQTRDFIHINDTINAYKIALRTTRYGTYNIGSGKDALSIQDIANIVNENCHQVLGYRVPLVKTPKREDRDWKDFVYSTKKAKDTLNFESTYHVLDEVRNRLNARKKAQYWR